MTGRAAGRRTLLFASAAALFGMMTAAHPPTKLAEIDAPVPCSGKIGSRVVGRG